MHTYVCVYICTYVFMYIYIYTYMYTHYFLLFYAHVCTRAYVCDGRPLVARAARVEADVSFLSFLR